MPTNRLSKLTLSTLAGLATLLTGGCNTVPDAEDRGAFIADARNATDWFKSSVYGLDDQIAKSAGYIVFPSVGQWGLLFGGGKFGRGVVSRADGSQIGWSALNTVSAGLQAGVQGFKMLIVFETEEVLERFQQNKLSGGVNGVVVVAEQGASGAAQFEDGVAMYQGANSGLMAGVNIGLDVVRYEPL